jgi:ABC-type sugar transport system permease subunit
MVVPAVLLASILWLAPLAVIGGLSFFRSNLLTSTWAGLRNYIAIWRDPQWQMAVVNSGVFAAMMVVGGLSLALLIGLPASALSRSWRSLVRISVGIPMMSSGIIIGQFWMWVFRSNGLANWLVGLVGAGSFRWLGNRWLALVVIGFVVVVSVGPMQSIIVMAALEGVPRELREAARMDGCGMVRTWLYVDIPHIAKTLIILAFMAMVGGFGVWENVYMLTRGGPEGATASMVYALWDQAFIKQNYGMAAAESMALLALVAGVSLVIWRLRK